MLVSRTLSSQPLTFEGESGSKLEPLGLRRLRLRSSVRSAELTGEPWPPQPPDPIQKLMGWPPPAPVQTLPKSGPATSAAPTRTVPEVGRVASQFGTGPETPGGMISV